VETKEYMPLQDIEPKLNSSALLCCVNGYYLCYGHRRCVLDHVTVIKKALHSVEESVILP